MKKLSRINRCIGTLAYCLVGTLFLFSCTQDLVQPVGADGETVSVRLNITTAPMQVAGNPLPRAATDKTDDELAVYQTWVLQFNGNTAASRLLKADEVTFTGNVLETELLHTDGTCRVYVVANSDCAAFAGAATAGNGISLADFEASLSAFSATQTVDAGTGLPMCGYQDFNPRTDAPAAGFTLKPLVSKLTFKLDIDPGFTGFTVNSIVLKQVAGGATYKESVAGNEAVRPAGATYTGELDLTGADAATVTCYLPENLSGKNTTLKGLWERGKEKAPANAAYVEVTGTTADGDFYAYSFFLGDGTPQDFNVARNYHYSLTATLNGSSEADQRVEKLLINLSREGTANCYLVYDNESYYAFDATVMGNGATTEAATQGGTASGARIVPQALAPESVKVLWETGSVAGAVVSKAQLSPDKTKVLFETGAAAGNAVIAVYDNANPDDPDANILWSWHIWKPETEVTDFRYQKYVDNTGVVTTADNYRMLDRNLGATTAIAGSDGALGLMYQWGRKDPFPGAKDKNTIEYMATVPALASGRILSNVQDLSTLSLSDNAACLAYAIDNPTTFLKGVGGWRTDWIKEKQDNLWGNPWEGEQAVYSSGSTIVNSGVGRKSIYDPCPVGYRVAPQDTWTALQKGDGGKYDDVNSQWDGINKGWSSTSMSPTGSAVFFPASGYAHYGDGSFYDVGGQGVFWSSSPYHGTNDGAGGLGFYYIGVLYPVYDLSRAHGDSVRCVAELD